MIEPAPGILLISDPFLSDPNFMRTVVFLCEHDDVGSLGFVLNRLHEDYLDELLPDLEGFKIPVYYGGPVQTDTLQFLHCIPELIPNGVAMIDGVYWGGDFEQVLTMIRNRTLNLDSIRFFLGYSGWTKGQLDEELAEKSWLTANGESSLVFNAKLEDVWKNAVGLLGPNYKEIINYPIDPLLN